MCSFFIIVITFSKKVFLLKNLLKNIITCIARELHLVYYYIIKVLFQVVKAALFNTLYKEK